MTEPEEQCRMILRRKLCGTPTSTWQNHQEPVRKEEERRMIKRTRKSKYNDGSWFVCC